MSKEKVNKKPKSKGRKLFEKIFTGVFVALIAFVGGGLISGMIFQVHSVHFFYNSIATAYVKTDSMEPIYPTKSNIIIKRTSADELVKALNKGETVDLTFLNIAVSKNPAVPAGKTTPVITNEIMTHRLISYYEDTTATGDQPKYYFYAEGINHESHTAGAETQYQVFTENEIIGRVIAKSVFLGKMTEFITSTWGLLILILIPSFYMIITSVLDLFKAYKDPEEEKASNNDNVVSTQDGTAASTSSNEGDRLSNMSEEDKARLKDELLKEMLKEKKGK